MRARRSPEARTIGLLRLVQGFVIGVSASLASGLIAASCYNEVAVEGVPARKAIHQRLGKFRSYLAGLLDGSDERSSSEAAMKLLAYLYEIDLRSRERWIQIGVATSVSIGILVSLLTLYRSLSPDPLFPLLLLPLYFLLPKFEPLEVPDPALADSVASDLEVGGGRVYAMRHLGLYERIVVDGYANIPDYFNQLMTISRRDISASVMRKTANLLRELKSIVDSWRAELNSLRRLFLSLVVLMAGVNLGVCLFSERAFSNAPIGFLFTMGLTSSVLASRPLRCPVEAALIYAVSFSMGMILLGI